MSWAEFENLNPWRGLFSPNSLWLGSDPPVSHFINSSEPGTNGFRGVSRWNCYFAFNRGDENDRMPRIKTAPSTVVPARRPVHYHLLLRPALQRSFARACAWCFVVSCIVSFLLGRPRGFEFDLLSWRSRVAVSGFLIPLSPTLLRGVLLFSSAFPILVIRKAELHGMSCARFVSDEQVQLPQLRNPAAIFHRELFSVCTVHSELAYLVSGICMTYLYLRTCGDLGITVTRFVCTGLTVTTKGLWASKAQWKTGLSHIPLSLCVVDLHFSQQTRAENPFIVSFIIRTRLLVHSTNSSRSQALQKRLF